MTDTTRQYRVSLHKLSYKSANMYEIIEQINVLKETDKCVFYGKNNREFKDTIRIKIVRTKKEALSIVKEKILQSIYDKKEELTILNLRLSQVEEEEGQTDA